MKKFNTYKVGGYVRDKMMGHDPKDCDFVVVGATPEDMTSLGYTQVGKDFPVFLHPKTGDEYALARTERKNGHGYNGFEVEIDNVTLEEDLFRRDLTINAMALDDNGNVIDPYNGQQDLKNGILRHVGPHFKEDPVRILRIARFSARYNFTIAPETIEMMKEMVSNGEFDHLTGERVWKEFEKVLTEPYLVNFFENLEKINALKKVPGFKSIKEIEFFKFISENHSEHAFTLNLVHTFSQMDKKELAKWKMPADLIQKINLFNSWQSKENFYQSLSTEEKLDFIQRNKALHQLDNTKEILYCVHAYNSWKYGTEFNIDSQNKALNDDVQKLKTIDYEHLVKEALANKQKPNEVVKSSQLEVLNKSHNLKRKP